MSQERRSEVRRAYHAKNKNALETNLSDFILSIKFVFVTSKMVNNGMALALNKLTWGYVRLMLRSNVEKGMIKMYINYNKNFQQNRQNPTNSFLYHYTNVNDRQHFCDIELWQNWMNNILSSYESKMKEIIFRKTDWW